MCPQYTNLGDCNARPRYDRILGLQPVPLHQISGRSAVASTHFFSRAHVHFFMPGNVTHRPMAAERTRVCCPKTRAWSGIGDLESPRCASETKAQWQAGKFRHGFTKQGQACQGVSVRWWHNAESLTSTARQTCPGERIRTAHASYLLVSLNADV